MHTFHLLQLSNFGWARSSLKDLFLLLLCIIASFKTNLSHVSLVMARKIHSFSLGVSLKTCWEFLVSPDAGDIHKDHAVFPSPLKICCGLAPNCKQYSVCLKSLPVQIGSSRGREAAVHTVLLYILKHFSTAQISGTSQLLVVPSKLISPKEGGNIALREANSPLCCWSRIEGANQ